MATCVHCECGWRVELSEFYAGKRIRCPECERALDVPGESVVPLYNSKLPEHAVATGPGRWVPVHCAVRGRRHCGGFGLFVMVATIVVFGGMLNQCRNGRPAQTDREQFKPEPKPAEGEAAPESPEQEEDF